MAEATLEQKSESEDSIIKSKLYEYLCLGLHFGGEIAFVGYMGIGAINSMYNLGFLDSLIPIGKGTLIYALTQPPAFYFKGLSLTREGNYHLARKMLRMSKEEEKAPWPISTLAYYGGRQIAKMHLYFARKMKEKSDRKAS